MRLFFGKHNPLSLQDSRSRFEETSWGELLRVTAIYLFETFPEKGSQRSFISNRLVKAGNSCFREENEFQRGLSRALVNCNHTALHAYWLLEDLLDFFGMCKDAAELVIHRPPSAEPGPAKLYFKNKCIADFKDYLSISKDKSPESIEKIARSIDAYLNPMLAEISNSYTDFFLFDSSAYCYNYAIKVRSSIEKSRWNERSKATLNRYLNYLVEFYRVLGC